MTERSCVHKFIAKAQCDFASGATLIEVLGKVDHYQKLVRRVYGHKSPFKKPCHRLGTSKLGLSSLALYEYVRFKGAPLPDANIIITPLLHLCERRSALCGDTKSSIDPQELINF